jgi:hypothetical protein
MAENWLKDYGFTALALPRRNLNPADVLYRGNDAFDTKVGTLGELFPGAGALDVEEGEQIADITRSVTKKVEVGVGLRILGALFGAAASSKLGADTDVKHAKTVSVTYENVSQDSLSVLGLQSWLERVEVNTAGQTMEWLNQGRLAPVTAVLRTADLSIVAERDNGAAIDLSVPEIEGIVSASATVSRDSGSTAKITFNGRQSIAFGFQAFKLLFEGNVSFGIEQIRRGGRPAEDVAEQAWSPDEELPELEEGSPPKD